MNILILLIEKLIIAFIIIFLGFILILYTAHPVINVFHLNKFQIDKIISEIVNVLSILFWYIMISLALAYLNDNVILWKLHHVHFHFSKFMGIKQKSFIISNIFANIITISFIALALVYLMYFIFITVYFLYKSHHLNNYFVSIDLRNFFSKIIMYSLTAYSILLGVIHSIVDVRNITFEETGIIIIVPAIAFAALMGMTYSHEKKYVHKHSIN